MYNQSPDVPNDVPPAMPQPTVMVIIQPGAALPQPATPAAKGDGKTETAAFSATPRILRYIFVVLVLLLLILAQLLGVDPATLLPTRI